MPRRNNADRPRRSYGTNPSVHVAPPLDWTITTEWSHNGRRIVPGTELKIRVREGRNPIRVSFVRHVRRGDGAEWVDVVESGRAFRSFRPDQIETVHRLTKMRR